MVPHRAGADPLNRFVGCHREVVVHRKTTHRKTTGCRRAETVNPFAISRRPFGRGTPGWASRINRQNVPHLVQDEPRRGSLHTDRPTALPRRTTVLGIIIGAVGLLAVASCNSSNAPLLTQSDLDAGWPSAGLLWRPKSTLPANWAEGKKLWRPKNYPSLRVALPQVANAQVVGLDAQCVICHEAYVTAFANNVHRRQGCEDCHGAASRHIETRGNGFASILQLKATEEGDVTARTTTPAERSEVCLQCHETAPQPLGVTWRTSSHAHHSMSCNDCHVAHYNVPPGTPPTVLGATEPGIRGSHASYQQGLPEDDSLRGTSRSLGAVTPDSCYKCHGELKRFEEAIHPHQIGAPIGVPRNGPSPASTHQAGNFDCTTCHDPHGNVLATTRKALCLQCHDGAHMNEWHGSQHDLAGIGCTDCHNPHPKTGVSMSVDQPGACYRCHAETRQLEEIAGPHQLLGPNNFNCSTCHRPHGKVTSETRNDLCLKCHTGTPTMAWHTSFHAREGVACADCHDAHPTAHVARGGHKSYKYSAGKTDADERQRTRHVLPLPPSDFRHVQHAVPPSNPGRQNDLFRLPRRPRSGKRQPQGGDAESAVLPVPRGQGRSVRLGARTGNRELCVLPCAPRHRGQQPSAPTDDVSLLEMPQWALDTWWITPMQSMSPGRPRPHARRRRSA